MADGNAPYHAHIYYSEAERPAAEALRNAFLGQRESADEPDIRFVGPMRDRPVGPHPIAQYEVHFAERSRPAVVAAIEASGLRALVHPLTDDDLADHTTLAHWIGEPLALELSVLDPPGVNKGMARFGDRDF